MGFTKKFSDDPLRNRVYLLVHSEPKIGKGHRADDVILTPSGWKKMRDLRVGDMAIGPDGRPTRITGVFNRGRLDVMRVSFNDGAEVFTDPDHLWAVAHDPSYNRFRPWTVMSTREIAERGMGPRRWRVPMVPPIEHPEADLPVEPYLLGVLIGDGCLQNTVTWSKNDSEIAGRVRSSLPEGHWLSERQYEDRNCKIWSVLSEGENAVRSALRSLELWDRKSWQKFIPRMYLFASIEQRTALLQGLMDTDGTVGSNGRVVVYNTTSDELKNGVVDLVRSLGGITRVTSKEPWYTHNGERRQGRTSYSVTMRLPPEIAPFFLPRKLERYLRNERKKPPGRRISSIEHVGQDEIICISVDHPSHLYVAKDYVLTHNTMCVFDLVRRHGHFVVMLSFDDGIFEVRQNPEVYEGKLAIARPTSLSGLRSDMHESDLMIEKLVKSGVPRWKIWACIDTVTHMQARLMTEARQINVKNPSANDVRRDFVRDATTEVDFNINLTHMSEVANWLSSLPCNVVVNALSREEHVDRKKTGRVVPAIVGQSSARICGDADAILYLAVEKDGKRIFQCQAGETGGDRSGRLGLTEPPDLFEISQKMLGRRFDETKALPNDSAPTNAETPEARTSEVSNS